MTTTQQSNRLQNQLLQMIALEAAIEQKIKGLISETAVHPEVTTLLTTFKTLSKKHRQALETRLHAINDIELPMEDQAFGITGGGLSKKGNYPISMALQTIYTMFNQAVIGYAVLHPLATRFLDSTFIADEGTSFHLARQHTQNYVQAIQQISRLIHDVVIWELDCEGYECQCICPACGVGICLCSLAGRSFLSTAWSEAEPIAVDEDIFVQLPKQSSAAVKAGLRRGDVILGTDGQEFESWGDIQSIVRNAKTGEEIRLTVRRESDEHKEIVLLHP